MECSLCLDNEDIYVSRLFNKIGVYVETYPEHIREQSPTQLLYKRGFEGISLKDDTSDLFYTLRYWEKKYCSHDDFFRAIQSYPLIDFIYIAHNTPQSVARRLIEEFIFSFKARVFFLPMEYIKKYEIFTQNDFIVGCSFNMGIYFCTQQADARLKSSICTPPTQVTPFLTPKINEIVEEKEFYYELYANVKNYPQQDEQEQENPQNKSFINKVSDVLFGRSSHSKIREEWKEYLRNRERFGLKNASNRDSRVIVFIFSHHPLLLYYVQCLRDNLHTKEVVIASNNGSSILDIQNVHFSELNNILRWNDRIFYMLANPLEAIIALPYIKHYGGNLFLFDIYLHISLKGDDYFNIQAYQCVDFQYYPHPFEVRAFQICNEIFYALGLEKGKKVFDEKNIQSIIPIRRAIEYSDAILLPSEHSYNILAAQFPSLAEKMGVFTLRQLHDSNNEESNKEYFIFIGNNFKQIYVGIQGWIQSTLQQNYTLIIQEPLNFYEKELLRLCMQFQPNVILTANAIQYVAHAQALFILSDSGFEFEHYWVHAHNVQVPIVATLCNGFLSRNIKSFIPLDEHFCAEDVCLALLAINKGYCCGVEPDFCSPSLGYFNAHLSSPAFRDSPLRQKIAIDISSCVALSEISYFLLSFLENTSLSLYAHKYEIVPVYLDENGIYYAFDIFLQNAIHYKKECIELSKGDVVLTQYMLPYKTAPISTLKEIRDRGVDIFAFMPHNEGILEAMFLKNNDKNKEIFVKYFSGLLFFAENGKNQFLSFFEKSYGALPTTIKHKKISLDNHSVLTSAKILPMLNKKLYFNFHKNIILCCCNSVNEPFMDYLFQNIRSCDDTVLLVLAEEKNNKGISSDTIMLFDECDIFHMKFIFHYIHLLIASPNTYGVYAYEALKAGVPVLVEDNVYFKEVLGNDACYYQGYDDLCKSLKNALHIPRKPMQSHNKSVEELLLIVGEQK